ncbi:hypothetical protein KIN20_019781 [Parelaphostrongylus tenuis]|uniref:Uncharacterized protein n=1 Tax=Parelaphostrongylus tenuis TaxID=148309 RepID=A0AAD5MLJ5_PARTN|nr:hypothetical protein KIN20_019781 [Parelaphostrongylus tenuis]
MFLDRLCNANPKNAYVMELFDVTALYTNVSNDSALQATHVLLIQHQGAVNMYGLSTEQFTVALKECLNCNLQMVREILCSNERAGNEAATAT